MDLARFLRDASKSAITFFLQISIPKNFKNVNFQGPKRSHILSFSMVETLRAQFALFHPLLAALDISCGCNAGSGRPQNAFQLNYFYPAD